MYRITRDPSSGSCIQCLAITVMVLSSPLIMDVVGVMAAYLPVVHVCTAQSREAYRYISVRHNTYIKT